ncbi:unnamed protein product [Dovyalis caffra]|uniref:BHLH domain-containing protein n=1 Tax=Dovyalis caffra TaxID=77055 RepID=A0AAV1R040_9ROSI|nr:unnamed protein product [Dovyalis caffra]
MRNALLPPVSSHLYNFAGAGFALINWGVDTPYGGGPEFLIIRNNEVQMPNLDVSMSMDGKINVHGTSFYLDSKVFNDGHQLRDGGFSIPYQSVVNYQPGCQSVSSTCSNISQQLMLPSKRVSIPEVQMVTSLLFPLTFTCEMRNRDFQAMQMRKRSINELNSLLLQRGPGDFIENKTSLDTWKTNKRKKANSPEEPWIHQARESINIQEQKFQVPVRRSQKLSDKITALQKLVSPYGKTDTASVLQEASLSIKLLQEQIQIINLDQHVILTKVALDPGLRNLHSSTIHIRNQKGCKVDLRIWSFYLECVLNCLKGLRLYKSGLPEIPKAQIIPDSP